MAVPGWEYCEGCGFRFTLNEPRTCSECGETFCHYCLEGGEGMCPDCYQEYVNAPRV